jgi:murein DD-endopeptidase MepM/ murein hydrolase activator NlpD
MYASDVAPGAPSSVVWDGLTAAGDPATGEMSVRVRGVGGEPIARSRSFKGISRFSLYSHIFPIRGRHTYGDGIGAGRNHGGQDMPASCGTPLVAARGGRVREAGYQRAGLGYYVVIDGRRTRNDYVYAHMDGPATVADGERVRTGQRIGGVGTSGRSSGCHLHFEMWHGAANAGGERLDPGPFLRRWDRHS